MKLLASGETEKQQPPSRREDSKIALEFRSAMKLRASGEIEKQQPPSRREDSKIAQGNPDAERSEGKEHPWECVPAKIPAL
jgi:hypothetical protein